jgi:hypothetical protein
MVRPVIRLYQLEELALIIECPSGVLYTNQAGGNFCMQPETEGVLVPLGHSCSIEEKLFAYFTNDVGTVIRLEPKHADALDVILRTPEGTYVKTPTFNLEVDRSRLEESMEAWIYVTITTCPDVSSFQEWNRNAQPELPVHPTMYTFAGFGRGTGVLTWANSD